MGKGVTKTEIALSASWNPRCQVMEMYGVGVNEMGERCVLRPVEFSKASKERFETIEPFMFFDGPEKLQGLFDDMWRIGLRPTEKADGYKAELAATKTHLNDMRNIVFKKTPEDLV